MRVTVLALMASFAVLTACTPAKPQNFDTPEAAVQALIEAAQAPDEKPLLKLLGKSAKEIVNSGDEVADKNARERFVAEYQAANSLDKSVENRVTLEVGEDKWPFPIPVVLENGKWHFDSASGADELINRRVGANELATIQSCLAYVDAQHEYYMRNAEQDSLQHYAAKLVSTDGKKDGLYWPTSDGEEPSPLGEGFARARAEGYLQEGEPKKGAPFHGYIYRGLTGQGPGAPGGAYDYVVNDKLLGGFAVIAFPAEYGNSGVMTFIVNHDGVVYSRDLGPDTTKLAMAIDKFDPVAPWKREEPVDPAAL
ncbi:MAG TPA: DUF2950 domain-containing protein [Steroidobacteraceae bacterium]|nr:DUF2950 domain-containing protein [Steroidobacteraceae bacterium]